MKFSSGRRFATGLLITVAAVSLVVAVSAQQKAGSGYHLVKTIPLPPAAGGEEYFDYITVDADARRVYVSHGTEG